MRERMELSGLWRFQPDLNDEGEGLNYPAEGCDVRRWREVDVPGRIDTAVVGMESYEGPAWLRRTFRLPESWRGRRIVLRFQGVNGEATVWLNGQLLGSNEDGFLPFEFRVDPLLRFDRENVLSVRVDNTRRAGRVPGLERGWRPFGGILREVEFLTMPLACLSQVRVRRAGSDGLIAVAAQIVNDSTEPLTAECAVEIVDPAGTPCGQLEPVAATAAAGAEVWVELGGQVTEPQLWSPDSPKLYALRTTLRRQGQIMDRQEVQCGFRTVQVEGPRLLLNDQPLYLAGFNRHEDSPRRDMCPDLETVRADLLDMKRLGANFVRLCHYPHHPAELDLCDQLGLLAMGEIPLYWWSGYEPGREAGERTLQAARRQLTRMIDRDSHHPSLVFWSVSNETAEELPEVAAGNAELCRLARQLDPSRLTVHVSNRWTKHRHFEADDVLCVNAYPGVWDSRNPQRDPARSAELWRQDLAELHRLYPDRPILVTEFGHPAFEGVFGIGNGEDAQARALEAEFAAFDLPYVCGAVIWCYAHHPWPEGNWLHYITTSPFGIVSRERRRLTSWPVVQRMFHGRLGKVVPAPSPGPAASRDLPVRMIRRHMKDLPQCSLPEGYTIGPMGRGDGALWTDVQRDAEPLLKINDQLFWWEFGDDPAAIERRCYLIRDPRRLAVGTISGWYSRDFRGQDWGRIHWVAVRPSQRGQGLARAGMTYTMNRLAQWHEQTWLLTSSTRLAAIRIYLDFGFEPDLETEADAVAWRQVAAELDHPTLRGLRK